VIHHALLVARTDQAEEHNFYPIAPRVLHDTWAERDDDFFHPKPVMASHRRGVIHHALLVARTDQAEEHNFYPIAPRVLHDTRAERDDDFFHPKPVMASHRRGVIHHALLVARTDHAEEHNFYPIAPQVLHDTQAERDDDFFHPKPVMASHRRGVIHHAL